ncbi:MAG: hypothetical protein K0B08_04455 [Bacteroidales bacterium]|nr:hypothetical protein [Bacteroidales bacterium]
MTMIKPLFLLFSAMLIACLPAIGQTTGTYDENIQRSVKKLQQFPGRTKDIGILKENYNLANAADQERIRELQATGQPDIWLELYKINVKMDKRQELVNGLPDKTRHRLGLEYHDYTKSIKEARNRAGAYLYARAQRLLGTDKPDDARQAYDELFQLARLNDSYKEMDKLIRKAILTGATAIEFELHNKTGRKLSSAMDEQLTQIVWAYKKARYGQTKEEKPGGKYHFSLRVNLDEFNVGPDQIREVEYQEERDVYEGNEVVDTIRCFIKEYRQLKKASLSGSIEFYDHYAGQVINSIPLNVESVFTNAYAFLQGDAEAASSVTRELLASKKAAYPSEEQMILDAADEFAKKAIEVLLGQ